MEINVWEVARADMGKEPPYPSRPDRMLAAYSQWMSLDGQEYATVEEAWNRNQCCYGYLHPETRTTYYYDMNQTPFFRRWDAIRSNDFFMAKYWRVRGKCDVYYAWYEEYLKRTCELHHQIN